MADRTVYRITTQIVNPDKTLGDLVDIVEMESLLEPAKATSYQLWKEYEAAQKDIDERCTCVFEDGDSMACPVHNSIPDQTEHPATDEHLAGCASCMMAHDKGLPDSTICSDAEWQGRE